MNPHHPIYTLFPYTTLFRSHRVVDKRKEQVLPDVPHGRLTQLSRPQNSFKVSFKQRNRGAKVESGDHAEHRSEEHTSELQSLRHLVCRLLLEKKKTTARPPRCQTKNNQPQPVKAIKRPLTSLTQRLRRIAARHTILLRLNAHPPNPSTPRPPP